MSASRVTVNPVVGILGVAALIAAGSLGTWMFMREKSPPTASGNATPLASTTMASPVSIGSGPLPDVAVPISDDAVKRAGIVTVTVTSRTAGGELRLPGIVEPNAYRHVDVTPVAAGRITNVPVVLGSSVRRGQTLAQIYSPELADAETTYVASRAMLEAHNHELRRTEKLVTIGAASRQELERIHAEHAAQSASLQSARARLELLGVAATALDDPSAALTATINVPAPIAGVVTERLANQGLNVDPSMTLFTVVDLSSVWVVADVFEKDFSRVRLGNEAVITTSAYPQMALRGRVSYIDPQVAVETRTAKVRVEVDNPGGELRLGMYADVVIASAAATAMPVVPRSAVQNVGDRTVVYLVDRRQPGVLIEREVRLGAASRDIVVVESGVKPGDTVVAEGSFFVRAERDRLGLRPPAGGDRLHSADVW